MTPDKVYKRAIAFCRQQTDQDLAELRSDLDRLEWLCENWSAGTLLADRDEELIMSALMYAYVAAIQAETEARFEPILEKA